MRTSDVDILMVPGWGGSGPDHWQARWAARLATARTVGQADWNSVMTAEWTANLLAAVAAATRPVVLVGHSCGVPTIVHAAARMPAHAVIGALLVAPPSEAAAAALPGVDAAFTPYPSDPLPFPSWLIASRTDPYCPYDQAGEFALAWGSKLIDAGEVGHINAESGHGAWPEGALRLGAFLKQLGRS